MFKCDKCEKSFYLQWRLKKHEQLHTQRSSKPCKYFTAKTDCPFEKLGCKFAHQEISATEAVTESDKIAEKIESLEDSLRKSKDQNELYSDMIAKAEKKTKMFEIQNKKLKDKLLEYRSVLQKLTDTYESK